jgi:1,4-dihydroxy-2-naphthoate polyprenyltransferase
VLAQGLLFGFGQLLIAGYSNTYDIAGDKEAGRRTVAVLITGRGNTVFLGILTAANIATVLLPPVAGTVPVWFAVAMLPFLVVRLCQYVGFLRTGDPLTARRRGITAFRTAVACMLAFNILIFVT